MAALFRPKKQGGIVASDMQCVQGCHAFAMACPFSYCPLYAHHDKHDACRLCSFERITAMAAYQSSHPAPVGAVSIFRSGFGFRNLFSSLSVWNDARMTRNALGKLSDRELDDIGLCRGDVEMLGR